MLCLRILTSIIFLFFASNSYAEMFIKYNTTSKNVQGRRTGDCKANSICTGFNNSGLKAGFIIATKSEYNKASDRFTEVNTSLSVGSRVVNMTTTKKNNILAAEATALKNLRKSSVDNFEVNVKDLGRALVNLNVANTSGNPITGAQIKSEIKTILNLN